MDLFDYMRENNMEKEAPLAARLRPTTLDEVVGQQHIIGKDKLLYRAIQADKISSIIFTGRRERGNDTGKGHCQYDECGVYPDQCHSFREKGHGGSGGEGQKHPGDVWKKNDSVY